MAELVGHSENAAGTNGVDKEGVWAVEGVDEAAVLVLCPAAGLHGSRDFEGEFVEIEFAFVLGRFAFEHEAAQVTVGGYVVEAMIVYPNVADVGGHGLDGFLFALLEKCFLPCGIILENGTAGAETFGPFCPATGAVLAGYCKNRRALAPVIVLANVLNFLTGELPEAFQGGLQLLRLEVGLDFHEWAWWKIFLGMEAFSSFLGLPIFQESGSGLGI